ncbi:hypothetical protein [Sphingobacterium sp. JB170]|uniref:hypothetical protein n=1 Tax=Sphingobacterium sp. JB170 TaxID=1434842 RepID=UPI00097ECB99|nr:hypothetical protein [Sphingobacterium sp. JB170]SJN22412.1 hypothetical protein FM107_03305 [Sphingobacterium sp. JB170]
MNRTIFLTAYLLLLATLCHGQSYVTIVYDSKHLAIVGENAAVRSAAEVTHGSYLSTIKDRLDDINLNVSSVVLVQDMIHRGLTEVDQALRTGLTVRQIGQIGTEIIHECNLMVQTAKDAPYLLLFAEDVARHMKNRGVNLASEVSEFVLKEGQNVLMDYEKRDALLRKIVLELRVMRALAYSMHRSMYYAKLRGILRSINPYGQYINQDRRMVDDIIHKVKILKD